MVNPLPAIKQPGGRSGVVAKKRLIQPATLRHNRNHRAHGLRRWLMQEVLRRLR